MTVPMASSALFKQPPKQEAKPSEVRQVEWLLVPTLQCQQGCTCTSCNGISIL
jgi:hypothetical protein